MGVPPTVRSFASAIVILVLSSCGGDQRSTPAPTTTNTTAVQETTSTTVDLVSVRSEAARLCVAVAEGAAESTPGLAEELTPETIDLLV